VILANKATVLLGEASGERCRDESPGLATTAGALKHHAVALNDTPSVIAAQQDVTRAAFLVRP
jgi:hypothetical protein